MTWFRRRPALAVGIVALVLLVLAPVSYALVKRIILSVDPDQSETQIEKDVKQQLEAAGVSSPQVTVNKGADQTSIAIEAHEAAVAAMPIDVQVRGGANADKEQLTIAVEVACKLPDADMKALNELVPGDAFLALARGKLEPAALAKAVQTLLAEHGFHDVNVNVTSDRITIRINAPRT